MLAVATVRTPVHLHRLGVAILLFVFRPDIAKFPSITADVIMLILKNLVCHVVILPNVLFVGPCLPLFMILKLDEAFDLILFQIQQVLLTAVAAVDSHCLQCIAKRIPVLF